LTHVIPLAELQGIVLHVAALVANAVATDEATQQLHIAAMAAIRNSASGAPTSVRQDILVAITWRRMLAMLQGSNDLLALHAWRTLQNLCHTMDGQAFAIEVLKWSGLHLLELAVDLIQGLVPYLSCACRAGLAPTKACLAVQMKCIMSFHRRDVTSLQYIWVSACAACCSLETWSWLCESQFAMQCESINFLQ
jgi:hypothetical protein